MRSDNIKASVVFVLGFMLTIATVGGVIFGIYSGVKAVGRYQTVQDANTKAQVARIEAGNEREVNTLRIASQAQKVLITQQDAAIRVEQAKGIKQAQDTISETLTPLYVQMQMVDALEHVATNGQNSTVIYIPVGNDGLPVVTIPDAKAVK